MRYALNGLCRALRDERGLETVEVAIVAGFIVVGLITAVAAIGVWVGNRWTTIRNALGA